MYKNLVPEYNLKHIAFFSTLFKAIEFEMTPKSILMGARKNKFKISRNEIFLEILHMKF